jgi:hypothetical protein
MLLNKKNNNKESKSRKNKKGGEFLRVSVG